MNLLSQFPENGWKMADGRLLFQALLQEVKIDEVLLILYKYGHNYFFVSIGTNVRLHFDLRTSKGKTHRKRFSSCSREVSWQQNEDVSSGTEGSDCLDLFPLCMCAKIT